MTSTAVLFGSTGLVGSHILSTLRSAGTVSNPSATPFYPTVEIIARRSSSEVATNDTSSAVKIREHISSDNTTWPSIVQNLTPTPSTLFYALGTTRAQAGNFTKQYTFETGASASIARAAKEKGVKTYILVTATGSNSKSYFNYPRMKGEMEEHVQSLDFQHTIILRPGMIIGARQKYSGVAEIVLQYLATGMGMISGGWLKDVWAQDARTIARAAVAAAFMVEKGQVTDKVWILGQKDIVRLGKTDWKD